ncbi:MAG: glycosyltransferase [Micropruina sp.]|nr:MAG: glycosyltransferase [Micropruina sp.]
MVVTEALAHGVPAIVGRGTGAEEALRSGGGMPGASVDPDDPDELAALLRRWLTDSALRADWRTQALAGRQRLRGWPQAAQEFADASGAGHDTVPGNGSGARNRAVAAVGPHGNPEAGRVTPRPPRSRRTGSRCGVPRTRRLARRRSHCCRRCAAPCRRGR